MTEKLPAPCEHCKGTGLLHGVECRECRGKGYRLIVNGSPQPVHSKRSLCRVLKIIRCNGSAVARGNVPIDVEVGGQALPALSR